MFKLHQSSDNPNRSVLCNDQVNFFFFLLNLLFREIIFVEKFFIFWTNKRVNHINIGNKVNKFVFITLLGPTLKSEDRF